MELIKRLDSRKYAKRMRVFGLFFCERCKKEVEMPIDKGKNYKTCGCWNHGLKRTRLNGVWASMKQRCFNKNAAAYKWYGARGITVCKDWSENFLKFRDWALNNGYDEKLEIDRINNDGNYEPSNCRWVTSSVNTANSRLPKLSEDEVILVEKEYRLQEAKLKRDLAKKFNVTTNTITFIVTGRTWKHLELTENSNEL